MRRIRALRKKARLKPKKKKMAFKKRLFFFSISGFLVLAGLFYLLFLSQTFQVKEIKLAGNEKISEQALLDFLWPKIQKQWWRFSSQSIFLINGKVMKKALLEGFPQIEKAIVRKVFPRILTVEIIERKAVANLCQDEDLCFLVDKEGVVFEQGKLERGPVIKGNGIDYIVLGRSPIAAMALEAILAVEKQLPEMKLKSRYFSLDQDKLTLLTTKGFEVYFSLKKNIQEQILNLGLILEEKIPASQRTRLEYIDLRFGSRVYYK